MKVLSGSFNGQKVLLLLSVIGPAIITGSVNNDAGGITTYSLAGAHFGYNLLWLLIPIIIFLIITQEMSVRMGLVTGKGLLGLIRENFGLRITLWASIGLLLSNLCNTVSEFAGIAASMELFGVSKYISVPVAALGIWLLVIKWDYKTVEKVFLIASLFYICYVIAGIVAKPPWGEISTSFINPGIQLKPDYLIMLIAIVGTTIAPWMQFYVQSAVVDKGLTIKDYKYSKIDVVCGACASVIIAFFIMILCAHTLFPNIKIETAQDAAIALKPLAGEFASYLFAFGLFNASAFAACILPLTTAYYICDVFGFESGVDNTFKEAPQFFILYATLIILGAVIILIPNAPLITIMYTSQVINGLLLPFVLIFMLLLINNKDLMGDYVNSRIYNWISWFITIVLIIITIFLVVTTVFPI